MEKRESGKFSSIAAVSLLVVLVLLLGGFSAFVGYHKAFSPLAELARHSAWTIHLPEWLGRVVGWLEMLSVAVLVGSLPFRSLARYGTAAAAWITLNHAVATVVHVVHKEWHTMTQSAVTIALCLAMVALYARRAQPA